MIEEINYGGHLYAIIINSQFSNEGLHFFTKNESSFQIAHMKHQAGAVIQAHIHKPFKREIQNTCEVLFIKRGKVKIDFYTEEKKYFETKILKAGDVILLMYGGHGFTVIDELEMYEVKQGPYVGKKDKIKF